MYQFDKQFLYDMTVCKGDQNCIVKGNNYRFTVISERLVRLEFSPTGKFVDYPSQLVRRRNLGKTDFELKEDNNSLQITTRYFTLFYNKEKPFLGSKFDPMKNLKITLLSHEKDRSKDWYYGHPEARNMLGNMISDDIPVSDKLKKGLYSLDGFASFDDSNSLCILDDGSLANREASSLDIYVFMYDRDYKQALLDYYKITGTPELIPRFALGNWWSRNITYDDTKIDHLIKKFEKKKIPLSVMLFDNDWHIRNINNFKDLKTGFTFNDKLFKDPKILVNKFHSRGIRVGLCVNPDEGFYPHEANYQQAADIMDIHDGNIIPFDALNFKSIDAYINVFLHNLESYGIDFFWNDSRVTDVNKLWSLNHYMYLDSGRNAAKRPMILSRGSIYSAHRYPVLYGGSSKISWENLRKLPFEYLNSSNIGVSWWSHDVGGNHGGIEESELYIRSTQLGVYSPILRFHSARGDYYKKEPWLWDPKTETIVADYLRLRHRLIPYLYTEAYNFSRSGVPIIQPFYYNYMWVYDDELYKNQYYFGSQLLVCPILDKMDHTMMRTVHRFFIPDGVWYDFRTGKKFPGNKKYISFFKEEDYPVFAHAGSIIPLSNRSDYNNVGIPTDMEIQIFPGVSNTYTLYEDDGVTSLYKEGYYLKTSIDYNYLKNNYTLIIRSIEGKSGIVPVSRNYKIVFRNTKMPEDITLYFNDQEIKDFRGSVDGNDFVIEVFNVQTIGQLTINCKGRDIEIDAVRLINDDVNSILMDLPIETYMKEEIASIMFGDTPIKNKRISIRKLKNKKLSKEYIALFLKLLEYISAF